VNPIALAGLGAVKVADSPQPHQGTRATRFSVVFIRKSCCSRLDPAMASLDESVSLAVAAAEPLRLVL
jgi:hypothetical protein